MNSFTKARFRAGPNLAIERAHMRRKIVIGFAVAALASAVALAQSFTTFPNVRVTSQLDVTGVLTTNGDDGDAGEVLTSHGASDPTWEPAGASASATIVTSTDQTSTLPNSRRLVAGANVTFNTTTPGELEIASSGGGGGGGVSTVNSGDGVTVDNSDPDNPVLDLDLTYAPTWSGIHTHNARPVFNGGTSGVSSPFSVDSTQVVTNLNADLLDGSSSAAFAAASHVHSAADVTSGTLAVARGGTGVTSSTGTGNAVLSASPTLTGTVVMSAATVGGSNVCRADGTNCPSSLAQTTGSYTATATGCTTSPTITIEYVRIGNIRSLYIPAISCTSNATSFTLTGGPTDVRPTSAAGSSVLSSYTNNGVADAGGIASMGTDGTLTLGFVNSGATLFFTSWTSSGTKAISASVMTYIIR